MKQFFYRIINRFNLLFRLGKILNDLAVRRGECKKCGICCGNCFFIRYNPNDKTRFCEIYKSDLRPYRCKMAPTKIDLKLKRHKDCGYYWDEE